MSSVKFLYFFLFKNGDSEKYQKLPVKKCDIDTTFIKKRNNRYYGAAQLFTLDGNPMQDIECDCSDEKYFAFVKVERGESFIDSNYKCIFDQLKEAKKRASESFNSKSSCPDQKSQKFSTCENSKSSVKPQKTSTCSRSSSCEKVEEKCSDKSKKSLKSKCSQSNSCVKIEEKLSKKSNCPQENSCEKVVKNSLQARPSVNFKDVPKAQPTNSNCSMSKQFFSDLEETVGKDNKNDSKNWSKTMTEINAVSDPCLNSCEQEKDIKPPTIYTQKHVHCVTEEKFPCCDDDESPFASDDEDEICVNKKKKGRRGFPCCCAKRTVESSLNISANSTASIHPENTKKCQTEAEDFRRAQEYYRKALENEKKRQKLYSRRARMSSRCGNVKKFQANSKLSEKDRVKLEEKYRKAKAQYRLRRKKMEEKATKSLQKELKKSQVDC